ncbi:MAG: tetratricopeptide repeat protein [Thaumarchaeota archaeon]|nr:tetratricopeptide repeat protein [Nitrososphaerota archaeon]
MYYPTLQNVKLIVEQMNKRYNMNVGFVNEGQLQFALEKPKMEIFGHQQYPELYQKAAALMETITKAHTLSDGNKRTAMLTAEFMINTNGAELILPLKAIRLSVDTAMDDSDSLSDVIQQWFKTHTATNAHQLCAMLYEHIEEETIIKKLWEANKLDEAEALLSKWMAFDSYPENKQAWDELTEEWQRLQQQGVAKKLSRNLVDDKWYLMWDKVMNVAKREPKRYSDYFITNVETVDDLQYNDNNMHELLKTEQKIQARTLEFTKSTDPVIVFNNGAILQEHGNYQDAVTEFEKLRHLDDDESHALYHIAVIHLYNYNDPIRALDYFRIFEKYRPNSSSGHRQLGITFVRLQQFSNALTYFDKVLKKYPDDHMAIFYKGICKHELGDYDDALQCFEQNISLDPKNVGAYSEMGKTYATMRQFEKAIEYFDKVIDLEPSNYLGYYYKGSSFFDLKMFDRAVTEFKKAYELNPEDLQTIINVGSSLSNSGSGKDGISYLQQALEKDPSHPIALHSMALTLVHLKQFDEATPYVERLLNIESNKQAGKYLKSIILANTGKVLESLDLIEELIRSHDSSEEIFEIIESGFYDPIKDSERFKRLIQHS